MKKFFFILFLFLTCTLLNAQTGVPTKGIFILPAIIDFTLTNGQVAAKTLTVQNRTDSSAQFTLYMADWRRDSLGRHEYYGPGMLPMSCTDWITLDKTFIEVPSGGNIPITVTMKIPDSASSTKEMKWAMLFIEVVNEKKVFQDTGVSTAIIPIYRLGVHIYQTPPNLGKKEIKMLSFGQVKLAEDSLGLSIECENVGDVHLKGKSSIEFTNLTDGTKTKIGPDPFSVFPGFRRVINYKIPTNLPKGKYSVLAILDGGEDMPIEAAQSEIEIK